MKIALVGGLVLSKNDSERHYVSPRMLCQLYGLNPNDCIFVDNKQNTSLARILEDYPKYRGVDYRKCIILHPRYAGDYKEEGKKIRAVMAFLRDDDEFTFMDFKDRFPSHEEVWKMHEMVEKLYQKIK